MHSVIAEPASSSNISSSVGNENVLPRPENMYPCNDGLAILHDTAIQLSIERSLSQSLSIGGSCDFLMDPLLDRPEHYKVG